MKADKKVKVALYMRVSTAEQMEGFSLDMQEKQLREHIARKQYKGWYTKKQWIFSEQGSGGSTDKREGLKKLIERAKKKEFDLVLVWKIDRISRSLTDLLQIFETLNKHEIGFASLKEDIDFTGAIGKLIFQIFGALAEFERETIKMRTSEGKKMSALQGNYLGSVPPLGYSKVANKSGKGSKLKIVKNEAGIIHQIFKWFAYDKWPINKIATELNKAGIPKSKNARRDHKHTKWGDSSVRGILTNEIYRGTYIVNRRKMIQERPRLYKERPKNEWIINQVDRCVSDILFYQAQERLKNGVKGVRGGGQETYMLKGKLVDIKTSKGFVGYKSGKNTKNYRRKKFIDSNGVIHKTMSVSAKEVEGYVWRYIETAMNKPKLFLEIHKKNSDGFKKLKSLESQYKIFEIALSKANERIERVKNDFYDGNIDNEEREERLAKYKKQRDENYGKLNDTEKQIKQLSEYDLACRDLEDFSKGVKGNNKLTYKDKKNIVSMVVEKIEIEDKGNKRIVRPFFRFDQKAIAHAIPSGRTDLVDHKAQKGVLNKRNPVGGGR